MKLSKPQAVSVLSLLLSIGLFASSFTLLVPVAHAEVRLGVDLAYAKSEIDAKGAVTNGSAKDDEINYGLFGQLRTSNSNAISYGVHLGWNQSGATFTDSDTQSITVQALESALGAQFFTDSSLTTRITDTNAGNFTGRISAEQDGSIDLLGLVAWNRQGITPFVMFGYSQIAVDTVFSLTGDGFMGNAMPLNVTVLGKDDATLKGWKLVGGAEGEFSQNWHWHVALEFADYGDESVTHTLGTVRFTDKIEMDSQGLSFGIAYRF